MKTQHFSTKTIGILFLMGLFYSQNALANAQNALANNEHSNNVTIALSAILFIIGFSVLITLKMHDDKKNSKQNNSQQLRHNRQRGHQYNH
jgi:heme/copper-type cytochrome/quinol oxidase subunit 2